MRRNIALYIADRQVDLSEQSFILFNYTMEDLSNPTIVKNSFSKQITIPGTANNNAIFGEIFRLDRVTQYGEGFTGVDFDVMRQTPFTIYNEMNEVVESGYVRLDKVTRKNDIVEYAISLYGGLGSFFYGLSVKADGTPMTLADMSYMDVTGGYTDVAGGIRFSGYRMLTDAWDYLADPGSYTMDDHLNFWANIINFAPCYNGYQEGFDADKILIDNDENHWSNVYRQIVSEGGQYAKHPDASSVLVTMTNNHTEWEMRDLRWYLQRPVFRVKSLIDAVCYSANNGGYSVELDAIFFSDINDYYENSWMTLPMIPIEKRSQITVINDLLKSTRTPAEYLISLAKTFNLVFTCDMKAKKVRIMHRSRFYLSDSLIDLSGRIDRSSIAIKPILAESRFYQFGNEGIGEWCREYQEKYGRAYGSRLVNTGNEFNRETKVVTSDIVYRNAADVEERSLLFTTDTYYDREGNGTWADTYMNLPDYEEVKSQLWLNGQAKEFNAYAIPEAVREFIAPINTANPLNDLFPKVQLHDADYKSIEGEDVLLFFTGFQSLPYYEDIRMSIYYAVTDDTQDMTLLNGGVPCYNLSGVNSQQYQSIPCFRRNFMVQGQGDSFDFGSPFEVSFPSEGNPGTIYETYWQDYQMDRLDDDTFLMTCKVNLKGFQVGQELMRNFFYYEGAYFVLNKINNHSLGTWDDTECEFVRVQDINNYI